MNETPEERKARLKKIGFQKGNKLALGNVNHKTYQVRAREYAETKGWDKLERWADSRNWKASIAALTTILAYAYGKPREQIKFEGTVPISIQQWFLSIRNTAINANGGIPLTSAEQPRMVLPGSTGDNGVGKANGHSNGHSG